jgi:hypothetical protein
VLVGILNRFLYKSLTKSECLVFQSRVSSFDSSNSAVRFVKFQNRLFTPLPLDDIKGLLESGPWRLAHGCTIFGLI